MSTPLTPDVRRKLLERAYQAIAREVPGCCDDDVKGHAGGINMIDENLDMLVEIIRRTTAQRIEPYQVQIMWDICEKCRYQLPSCYCALRHMGLCLLYAHAPTTIDVISQTLIELQDPDYLSNHPAGSGRYAAALPSPRK